MHQEASIAIEQYNDPGFYFDGEQLFTALKLVYRNRLNYSEPISIRVLEHILLTHLGMPGMVLGSCANIQKALEMHAFFHKFTVPVVDIKLHYEEDGIRAEFALSANYEHYAPTLIELMVGGSKRIFDEIHGSDLDITLHFSHAIPDIGPPDDLLSMYKDFFKSDVEFSCASTYLFFPTQTLNKRLKGGNIGLLSYALKASQQYLVSPRAQDTLGETVKSILAKALMQGEVISREQLAEHLNMSPRSFSRKLAEENLMYRTQLKELRFDLAKSLIKHQQLSTKQIAAKLGFADPKAFSKSFKAFFGLTPSQWKSEDKDDRKGFDK